MKRFLTVTALTSVMATSAFAASQAEMNAIESYYPEANFQTLTDGQVTEMFAIANSGVSDTEKATRIKAVASGSNPVMVSTENERLIANYLPDWRVMEMTEAEKAEAVAIISRGGNPQNISSELMGVVANTNPGLTPGEMQRVKFYEPNADLMGLTPGEVDDIRAALYSKQDDANIKTRINEILS